MWVQDLSFDGYLDLALPSFTGATDNLGWSVWLYVPAKGLFERSELLSRTSQLAVDVARQQLDSRWELGAAGALYRLETFRFPGGLPTLVRRESSDGGSSGAARPRAAHPQRRRALPPVVETGTYSGYQIASATRASTSSSGTWQPRRSLEA